MSRFDITIAGEINLDLILYGLPTHMPVERELIADRFTLTLGSSSAILAHNLGALGAKVGFATKVGADPLGEIAIQRLHAVDVSVSYPSPNPRDLTGVTVLLPHGETRHILTYLGVMENMGLNDIDLSFLSSSRHFHLSSLYLHKGLHRDLPSLCRDLKQRGLTLSLDTNDDPDDLWDEPLSQMLELIDVLLPNENEAKRMTHTDDLDLAIESLARRVPVVVVKCGSAGSVVQKGRTRWVGPALHVDPVDTIGAGDSFNAGFLKGYLAGLSLDECAAAGNAAAALSTLRSGGTEAFRDPDLLHQFLQHRSTVFENVGQSLSYSRPSE